MLGQKIIFGFFFFFGFFFNSYAADKRKRIKIRPVSVLSKPLLQENKEECLEETLEKEVTFFFDHMERISKIKRVRQRLEYFNHFLVYYEKILGKYWKLNNPGVTKPYSADYTQPFTIHFLKREKRSKKIRILKSFFNWMEDVKFFSFFRGEQQSFYILLYSSLVYIENFPQDVETIFLKRAPTKSQELASFS